MKDSFYTKVFWGLIIAVLFSAIMLLQSCDHPYLDYLFPDPPEPIEADTCTEYIEYTLPEFVGMYVKFDTHQDSIVWEGGGISSYDLGEVVSHVTNLPYRYGSNQIGAWVIIEGTNNHQQFQLKIFTRTPGGKWYLGTGTQQLWATGATIEDFKQNINDYPSVDMFTFYGSDWDSIGYVNICREILKDCKAGRKYADLHFIPFQLEQSLIDSFGVGYADWDRVRTN